MPEPQVAKKNFISDNSTELLSKGLEGDQDLDPSEYTAVKKALIADFKRAYEKQFKNVKQLDAYAEQQINTLLDIIRDGKIPPKSLESQQCRAMLSTDDFIKIVSICGGAQAMRVGKLEPQLYIPA